LRNALPAGTLLVTVRGVKRAAILFASLLLLAPAAGGTRRVENYPKVLAYSSAIGLLPETTQDSLSWYDVLVCYERPEVVRSLRTRNDDIRLLWSLSPQFATPPQGENPWWLPDTLWSPSRLIQYYAQKNDWYLRDTAGLPITDGSAYILNWTRFCPVGTFGSAKGLRAAEWMASVALPTIALSGRYWGTWSWDSRTAYNGFLFEILADCLGSYGWKTYERADPNRDGVAEGVYSACSSGGSGDPLSVLMREENDVFYTRLSAAFPAEFPFLINENNRYVGPWWRTRLSGMKLENWMRASNPDWFDWWDWFYGLTPPWLPGDNWGSGYAWTESEFDKPVDDHLKGWDLSFIEVWAEPDRSDTEDLREMRFGLGTTMLGDGYFTYTKDQRRPRWQPEFDWDFGAPLAPFQRELHSPADTLYVRLFDRGMVEVNPYASPLAGVPARDSRFTFWLPVQDLAAATADDQSARVTWTAPDGEENDADSFELRYLTTAMTQETWDQAIPYAGNPITADPGAPVSLAISGLQGGRTYQLAVRTWTRGRPEPLLSNIVSVVIPTTQDETPPAPIVNPRAGGIGETWIDLIWTATGDDGTQGTASSYLLRTLPGETIGSEEAWAHAQSADQLPTPHVAGSTETYRLTGLTPGVSYGIAIRAMDEAGNLSPLHPPLRVQTAQQPPPDTTPPAAIGDLGARPDGPGKILITWTAPGDDGDSGRATAYEVRLLRDRTIETESEWQAAGFPSIAPPTPSSAGAAETMIISSLTPGASYGIAVRAKDEVLHLAPLSNPVLTQAGPVEPPPPPPQGDATPPAAIEDLTVASVQESLAVLEWAAPGDDGDLGTAYRYELRILPGGSIVDEAAWQTATPADSSILPVPSPTGTRQACTVPRLAADHPYGASIRARDEAGNLGALGPGVQFRTPPHPRDPVAPEAVSDLRQAESETTSVLLVWSAPSDPDAGAAARYRLRVSPQETPDSSIWSEGVELTGLPAPRAPGLADTLLVTGLIPSRRYGFALRSEDAAGNLSSLSNLLWAQTADRPDSPPPPPPPSPKPPGAILDLVVVETGIDTARVAWTAPGDDGGTGRAVRYESRIRVDGAITEEGDWSAALVPDTSGMGRPSTAGEREEWILRGLEPATDYALAIRAVDDSGLTAPLSNPLQWRTASRPIVRIGPAAVLDLVSDAAGDDWADIAWAAPAPGADGSAAERYLLAVRPGGRRIETEDDWLASHRISGLPLPATPGVQESWRITELLPGRAYAIALRAEDRDGHLGPLAAGPIVTTLLPDSDPPPQGEGQRPASIDRLSVVEVGASWVDLLWTAVGGDSLSGKADLYALRILRGESISNESDWQRAHPGGEDLPAPENAGTVQGVRLTGLLPGEEYGIALRAIDAEGWVSPFVPGLRVKIVPYLPTPPPFPAGFETRDVGFDSAVLAWTQTGSSDGPNGIEGYIVAVADEEIDESNWEGIPKSDDPPAPSGAGETVTFRAAGLREGTAYWAAVQARSREGLFSPLSVAHFTTRSLDLAPPEPPSGLVVAGTPTEDQILLRWSPSPAPDLDGYILYVQSEGGSWARVGEDLLPATATETLAPASGNAYALSAVDRAGNEGGMSVPVLLPEPPLLLSGPFPHPVTSSCRFEIEIPRTMRESRVTIRILDTRGFEIRRLLDEAGGVARHVEVSWDRREDAGRRAAPGFYLVILDAGGRQIRRQIFLSP
jgi:hypothetical protein